MAVKQTLENISFVDTLSLTYLAGANFQISGGDSKYFKLETGPLGGTNLVFVNPPDFEDPFGGGDNSYSFTVQYKYFGVGPWQSDTFTVNVNDVNEAPTGMSVTTFAIDENTTTRTKVASLSVNDPDTNPAFKAYDYTLLSLDNRFEVDSNGDVYLKANKTLNYESGPIELTVLATDKSFPLLLTAKTFTLDVANVDEAPTALTLSNVIESLDENAPGLTKIADLTVTDPDTNPDFRQYTFKVLKSDGSLDERFVADSNAVYLKDGVSLDFETEPSLSLTVTAETATGAIVGQTFSFAVNDKNDAPTALDVEGGLTVAENTKTETKLGSVAISDADENPDFNTYTYTASNDRFGVKANGDLVLLADKLVNYENGSTIELTITATDVNDPSITIDKTVTVTVTDVNEAPLGVDVFPPKGEGEGEGGSKISFPENTSTKTELAFVNVFGDPDTSEAFTTYTYTLSDSRFEVDSGRLYLKAGQSTDFETEPTITLTLTAHDGEFEVSTEVIINVTDVPESEPGGGTPSPGPDTPTPTPNDFDGFIPALVVSSFVEGVVPGTMSRLESLANFAEFQFLSYQERGVADPALGPYEALGLGFSETTEFQDKYGALTEGAFITEAYEDVFGRAATTAQADHFQAQIDYFEALYASVGIAEDKAEMMAKGAALGQMLGFAVLDESATQPYLAQAQAFLEDASDGVVEMGKPLAFYELN